MQAQITDPEYTIPHAFEEDAEGCLLRTIAVAAHWRCRSGLMLAIDPM